MVYHVVDQVLLVCTRLTILIQRGPPTLEAGLGCTGQLSTSNFDGACNSAMQAPVIPANSHTIVAPRFPALHTQVAKNEVDLHQGAVHCLSASPAVCILICISPPTCRNWDQKSPRRPSTGKLYAKLRHHPCQRIPGRQGGGRDTQFRRRPPLWTSEARGTKIQKNMKVCQLKPAHHSRCTLLMVGLNCENHFSIFKAAPRGQKR